MSDIREGEAAQRPRLLTALDALGETPRKHLEWLLDRVVYADGVAQGSETEAGLLLSLRLLIVKAGRNPKIIYEARRPDDLAQIQAQLREALPALVAGQSYTRSLKVRAEFEFEKPERFDRDKGLVLAE